MKKVKITLKPGSTGRKFFLFPNAEALYVWACALERSETVHVDGIQELLLEPGGFIEAELRGFDYAYDEAVEQGQIPKSVKGKRLDLVRLGKAHQTSNASGLEVSTHAGWVMGNMLPLKRYSDAHIDVVTLNENDAKLDLNALFDDEIPVTIEE